MKPKALRSALESCFKAKLPVLLVGPPGVGKTDIVEQAARATNHKILISHPVVSDPTDFKGMPWARDVDGQATADFVPFGDLKRLVDAEEETVFFLDDLGQAAPATQAAAMQLLLARRINDHKVSDKVTFAAATNRREDMAGVQGILEPVKSRFTSIIHVEPGVTDWCEWAAENDMPPELIAFIKYRPKMIKEIKATRDMINGPSPRTIANAGKLIKSGMTGNDVINRELLAGAAGEGFASEFYAFLRTWKELPNAEDVFRDPSTAPIPTKSSVLHSFVMLLAGASRTKEEALQSVRYAMRIPAEYSYSLVNTLAKKHRSIATSSEYKAWKSKFKR